MALSDLLLPAAPALESLALRLAVRLANSAALAALAASAFPAELAAWVQPAVSLAPAVRPAL